MLPNCREGSAYSRTALAMEATIVPEELVVVAVIALVALYHVVRYREIENEEGSPFISSRHRVYAW